jgi:predicted nucleotidyltransferase
MTDVQRDTIFVTRAGSQAHGTAGPDSDVDLRGVCVVPLAERLSLSATFEQWEGQLEGELWERIRPRMPEAARVECVIFDVVKLLRLAVNGNPNALEILFADEADWVHVQPMWHRLHAERHRFLSKKVQETYLGYGLAQLKRIRTHRAWLLEPPVKRPEREDFGLSECTTLDRDARQRIEHAIEARMREYALDELEMPATTRSALRRALERFWVDSLATTEAELDDSLHRTAASGLGLAPDVVATLEAEKRYRNAARHFASYLEWKEQRNPRRAALEVRHGYDTKHAMHLIRLMRTGLTLLTTGELHVRRHDAEELIAIKNGTLTYDELVAEAEELASQMRIAAATSRLPDDVEREPIDSLVYELCTSACSKGDVAPGRTRSSGC